MADTPRRGQIPGDAAPGDDDGWTMSLLERVRPAWSGPTLSQPRTSAYVPGALAGLRAAGISFGIITVPLLAAWALASDVTANWLQALRLAADGWLLVHHVAVSYPGGQLGLVPLGLTLVPLVAAYRSAKRLAAEPILSQGFSSTSVNIRPSLQAVVGLAAAYAAAATLVALLVGTSQARAVIWQAPIGPGLLALVAGAAGIVRGHPRASGLRAELASWLPARLRSAVRPALVGTAVVLGAGLLLVVLALLTSSDRVLALHRALRPGGFGGVLLVVGQVGYLPDLAAWSVAWLAGPGFAVGSGTVVAPATVHLGVLPVVPVLGALPTRPFTSTWAVLAPAVVPIVAGLLAGWWSARRAPADDLGSVSRLLDALGAVVLGALVLGTLVALSVGPIGPGRLAHVGANALVVVPFLAMELAVGALPAAAVGAWWRRRHLPPPAPLPTSPLTTPPTTPPTTTDEWFSDPAASTGAG